LVAKVVTALMSSPSWKLSGAGLTVGLPDETAGVAPELPLPAALFAGVGLGSSTAFAGKEFRELSDVYVPAS
jgi:hypothetical protein